MKFIKLNSGNLEAAAVRMIVDYLKRGQVAVLPTDTVYGLSCRADSARAVNKIFRIKRREKTKPLICLVGSVSMAKRYCKISRVQEAFLKNKWPGPFTMILDKKSGAPRLYAGAGDSLALRLPKQEILTTMIKRLGIPIVSTSLNKSGSKKEILPADVSRYFRAAKPDLVVDGGRPRRSAPSTIVDIRNIKNKIVIRKP